ncbi:protein-Npi-phosphohistidine-sugar phosphotransferase [Acididesulfobacillus acetoxydans]|uniref:PTS system, Lactose/Cellobiose specific IIB subunit n=1 Tax=Acididesulfobacillus acetoxydans TaxID=1561005 RepID=A0A8S0WFC2_9FIRM|nr:PTS sugar transporter subunit IIB [Acididesulfobacillus acetoxydans]CAA7600892.1 protein-Npi-phosphohistidine-sugar phosphotransferase [Acididesulfobacillus acetoxydans]CEJ08298.1 PTS system, Lactose/Cellobiose specific IIB subunit [Acididesulfobacillus acetoxydans]
MKKKRIVVICGTGIATSTVVVKKTEEFFQKIGIQVDISQGRAVEANIMSERADLVLTTTPSIKLDHNVPILNAIPFLTGMGEDDLKEEILKVLVGKE